MVRPEVFVIFAAVLTHPGAGVLLCQLLQFFLIFGFPILFLVNINTATGNVWITAVIRVSLFSFIISRIKFSLFLLFLERRLRLLQNAWRRQTE